LSTYTGWQDAAECSFRRTEVDYAARLPERAGGSVRVGPSSLSLTVNVAEPGPNRTGARRVGVARYGLEDPFPAGDGDGVTADVDLGVLDGDGQAAAAGGCLQRAEAAAEASGPQRAGDGVS
jgi:hypothetical protein